MVYGFVIYSFLLLFLSLLLLRRRLLQRQQRFIRTLQICLKLDTHTHRKREKVPWLVQTCTQYVHTCFNLFELLGQLHSQLTILSLISSPTFIFMFSGPFYLRLINLHVSERSPLSVTGVSHKFKTCIFGKCSEIKLKPASPNCNEKRKRKIISIIMKSATKKNYIFIAHETFIA